MPTMPGFWDVGPHEPLAIEQTWRDFVRREGGKVLEECLPKPRPFQNADFLFPGSGVVAELKEVQTEFSSTPAFHEQFDGLMRRVMAEDPGWTPVMLGGTRAYPRWFQSEFIRIFRPPIARILKKANRQIRETKAHFNLVQPNGLLLFANDGFTSLGPEPIRALACDLLLHSYSSIDCFVYLTVNRYIELPGSKTPRLLWAPTYTDKAPDALVDFVDGLGSRWFDFLEEKVGGFTDRIERPHEAGVLRGSRAIIVPGERDG